MRVFVTGATGYVGSAIVRELISAGHTVLGLTRSDKGAKDLETDGADAHHGSLDDLTSLESGAAQADGVIHCAFGHDFSKFEENCRIDRTAIQAMADVLVGTNKPLIITSGTLMLKWGIVGTEDDEADKGQGMAGMRALSEDLALDIAKKGVHTVIVRLPPTVYGEGDKGFVPALIDIARSKGESSYIEGGGEHRWPSVHRLDAAKAYRLALEKAEAGSRVHPISNEGLPIKDLAAMIGKRLGLPVTAKHVGSDEANAHFGFFAMMLSADNIVSSKLTRNRLGWEPTQPTLLEDLAKEHYFAA